MAIVLSSVAFKESERWFSSPILRRDWRNLAADARADAATNRARAQRYPDYAKMWEDAAKRDDQRAGERKANAERLEARAYTGRAARLALEGRRAEARDLLERAVELDPDLEKARRDLEALRESP